MKGKITDIDLSSNSGILHDESEIAYTFSLDDCVGFEDVPEIGVFVDFGVNGDEIFYIEPLTQDEDMNSLTKELQEISIEDTSTKEEIPTSKTTAKIQKKLHKKEKFNPTISLSISLEKCLDEHFSEITFSIEEYEAQFEEYEDLDYLLMKRFLNTAYNNLRDMDSTFMDDELLQLHADLQALDKIYFQLVKKDAIPTLAYESIFLEKQKDYLANNKRLQTNSSEIFTLESSMKTIEAQIKQFEDKIREKSVIKGMLAELEKDLKRYRTYYVDTLHKIALLKEENILLKESLEKFAHKYENKFLEQYEMRSQKYFGVLIRQLNGYAYVFDKKMWERAEGSNSILTFFKKAHIDEDFSSKTFLKYFLKTLDKHKLSREFKRLEALLEYLESKAKIRCLLVHENTSEIDSVKHCIRRLDKDYLVEDIDKPRTIYYRKDLKLVDFIFIDIGMKNPPIEEFLTMLFSRLKQTSSKAKVCLLSQMVSKEMIMSAKKYKIDYFISLHVKKEELQNILQSIIEK